MGMCRRFSPQACHHIGFTQGMIQNVLVKPIIKPNASVAHNGLLLLFVIVRWLRVEYFARHERQSHLSHVPRR